MTTFAPQFSRLRSVQPARISGTVATLRGLTLLVDDLPLPIGSLVSVRSSRPNDPAVTLSLLLLLAISIGLVHLFN